LRRAPRLDEPAGHVPLRVSTAFRATAGWRLDEPALISDDGTLSYRQLRARMDRLANVGLSAWSVEPGRVIALIAPNRPEYIEIVYALSDLGAVVATLNPALTPSELERIYADCEPVVAIVDPRLDEITETSRRLGVTTVGLGPEYESLLDGARDGFRPEPRDERDSFCLCYTSGTTGAPKGVLLSHRSRALAAQSMAIEYGCFGIDDRFLALAPMCHGGGFAFAMAAISFGGTCVLFDGGDPADLAHRLGAGDISGVFMVPTHLGRLYSLPDARLREAVSGHRLRAIVSNAAALAQPLKERAVEVFGEGLLHEAYGSTEAAIVTSIRPGDLARKPGSVGLPFPNTEIEIRDGDGGQCAPGEIGELFSRGPCAFNGYLNRPDETAATLRDGWVTVQDLASRDREGFVTIHGRMKDMIVSGGVNIYPAEVESVIGRLAGVREVAVVGLPDPEWGERLHAFVVDGRSPAATDGEIVAACRRELSAYKIPRGITRIEELPRNAGGKILKRELRRSGAEGPDPA